MTGSALMDFLIATVGLCLIVYLIFLAIEYIAKGDAFFVKIAKVAIGGAALIMFLLMVKGVLFGGGGAGLAVTPVALIQFAIGLLVILVVLWIILRVVEWLGAPFQTEIKYVIGAIALIALLVIAERALTGERVLPITGMLYGPPAICKGC